MSTAVRQSFKANRPDKKNAHRWWKSAHLKPWERLESARRAWRQSGEWDAAAGSPRNDSLTTKPGWKWQIAISLKCCHFYEICFHKLLFKMNVQEGKKQLHLIPTWVKTHTDSVSRCDCVGLNEVSFHPYACRSTWSLEIQYLPSKCKYTQHMPDKKKQNPSLEGFF